ncbi:MAG: DUF559 domain-containing protein [Acidimicrobiia bacterium]|nr:DUF559 domain-containing protein [Acidimicrobiia bacterium]
MGGLKRLDGDKRRLLSLGSRFDLLDHGLASTVIEDYRKAGILEPLWSGVYVVPWLVDGRTPQFAALSSLATGAISFRSAGRGYSLPVPADDQGLGIEVTVPIGTGGRSFPGVTVHRTRLPLEIDVVEVDGLRTTSPARTVFDLASCVGPTVDFADPVACVVLEVDGRSWHSTSQAIGDDRRRDRAAAGHGWVVVRVVADEVALRPSSVIDEIRAVLVSRSSNRAA